MSDSRMIRTLPDKKALAEHEAWEKSNAHRLEVYRSILLAQLADNVRSSDQESGYGDAGAFGIQAHKAGFREGLRSALSLITPRA